MSTDLEYYMWPTSFACTLVSETTILPNQYSIGLAIEPVSPYQLAMGFRRLRTFVDSCLHNGILIFNNSQFLESLKTSETNLVQLPTEPYDYFLGSVLLRKFQVITSKYFEIGFMTIDSAMGDHVQYCIRDPEESGLDLSGEHWWNMDNLETGTKIDVSWDDLELNDSPKFEPRIIKGGKSENK